jgi:type III restriction enzyme
MKFHFEKDLAHQKQAVENTIAVFDTLQWISPSGVEKQYANPIFEWKGNTEYKQNIEKIKNQYGIREPFKESNIIDVMMETGTGKTYTYTKTMFELNKHFGIFKFIIVVPTLSIKAGTVDFLKSESCREHFREEYGKTVRLHVVESQKSSKSKKSHFPPAVSSFVNAGDFETDTLQVMIINAGMINSDTMEKSYDRMIFDRYSSPFEAIAATKAFMMIDEPHRFEQENKTWQNLQKMKPQFILRYGATFTKYENLVYKLTAVEAFNRNLVKGVIGHITEFESGRNAVVKFIDSDGREATFRLNDEEPIKLKVKESLAKVHSAMSGLIIEGMNRSKVMLSNGLELKKGDKINPYSYSETVQEIMIRKAIEHHFEIERKLLAREVKIKPLTLFFIDNIEEYRNKEGYIRKTVEEHTKAKAEELLKTEKDAFYKSYLEKTLEDLSATHAGYFSKDNTEKDEFIEKEINEILHDKQAMLDLENPRRFIFSKWTLREGWDNPNVFQICKLRSSGSEISKLQEVGRGLRLPVNEYGNRVKDEQFYLHYFIDFTESDFVDKLVNEINDKSGAVSIETPYTSVTPLLKIILQKYAEQFTDENKLLEYLDEKGVIKRNNDFREGGFEFIKQNFPLIFEGVGSNKVRKATEEKKKVTVRTSKYDELKELWEKLNQKVILEYKFDNEAGFKNLLTEFLKTQEDNFTRDGIREKVSKVEIQENKAVAHETESIRNGMTEMISTMKYSDFLKKLAEELNINMVTLHQAIREAKIDINKYRNQATLRRIKQNFDDYLMTQAFDKYSIAYKSVSNSIHPTKLTDENGNVLTEISASDIGVLFSDERVAESYFFEELYYDSELERTNITTNIEEVIVFTKIPKNSIKIPVAGGKSYSPDFAYVIRLKGGEQRLHFIVEAKNYPNESGLSQEEIQKIRHAEKFFGGNVKIHFKTQFSNDRIGELIKEILSEQSSVPQVQA